MFEIGETYTSKEVHEKLSLVEEKHKEYLDVFQSLKKRPVIINIDMFFRTKSYSLAPYNQIDEKGCLVIGNHEIDIIEKLEPLD